MLRDWRFLSALGFTISQQILLALSTYYIAQAGLALGKEDVNHVLSCVSFFFVFALLGYIASSIASFFSNRAANAAWRKYVDTTLIKSTESLQFASEKNKKTIAQWLGGEALSTIVYACGFYLGFVSVSLNVVLTLVVFYLSVGGQITFAMATSLAISLIFVMVLRHKIENSAGEMQHRKLRALLSVELTWNSAMFGSRNMRSSGFRELDKKISLYFSEVNKYVVLEQVIACLPIVISTVAVIALLQYSSIFTLAAVGALVAVLPRSLQVFGNVHSLSIYLSQFFLMRTKMRNLEGFTATLDIFHMMHFNSLQGISISEAVTARTVKPEELMSAVLRAEISEGRYTITGKNGSGKSTFLKVLKEMMPDALLMTPETSFLHLNSELSTGQLRIKEIENVLLSSPSVLLLDEWDANLDDENYRKINGLLELVSSRILIVEVRHLRQSREMAII